MITNNDRSGWIGASDTSMLFANPDTATFRQWWLEKLGLRVNSYSNIYMIAGTALEHQIINLISPDIKKGVKPVYKRRLKLRANYDGLWAAALVEIKTTIKPLNKVPLNYWRQVQSLCFATKKEYGILYAYLLKPENYHNFYLELHRENLTGFEIPYDKEWIHNEYLPRLRYTAACLRKRKYPGGLSEFNEKNRMSGL